MVATLKILCDLRNFLYDLPKNSVIFTENIRTENSVRSTLEAMLLLF